MEKTLKFKTNINCGGCVASVAPHLNSSENISHWSVDTSGPDKILTVQLKDDDSNIVKRLIEKAGFELKEIK